LAVEGLAAVKAAWRWRDREGHPRPDQRIGIATGSGCSPGRRNSAFRARPSTPARCRAGLCAPATNRRGLHAA